MSKTSASRRFPCRCPLPLAIALSAASFAAADPVKTETSGESAKRLRVIMSTDFPPIGIVKGGNAPADRKSDPDDMQSMVRFLLYANEFDIEGLIASAGTFANKANKQNILDVIGRYEEVYDNLKKHDPLYPAPDDLRSVTFQGRSGTWGKKGTANIGAGKNSEASDAIIAIADKPDPRPIYIGVWGDCSVIAQAVWKVQNTRSKTELGEFLSKLRVFDILGQDDAGAWLAKNFPDVFYIRATGVYGWAPSDSWIDEHVQSHGPLGAVYPDRKWATEGDTPSFMHVYPTGLNDPEKIDQGGWGGRFSFSKQRNIRSMRAVKTETRFDPYFMYGNTSEGAKAIKRWSAGYNNDFEARMDWSVTGEYSDANHHPVAIVNGDDSRSVLEVSAPPGSNLALSAEGSTDPDGDSLAYSWSFYEEPSSYRGSVSIENRSAVASSVAIPSDASGKNVHVILEMHDDGSPNLYAYRRVIIDVESR